VTDKAAARKEAFAARAAADRSGMQRANALLEAAVRAAPGNVVSGFWPIRTEIDPRPALHALAATHEICLPVVAGNGLPLVFRRWTPGAAMEEGAFGAAIPADPVELDPSILIVPLAAFDRKGYRLGYGGGFYDRTLERLRRNSHVTAIGFAFAAQEIAAVPRDATDEPLDLIVTEGGIRKPE
jgi:5-formyltetrahydrofolate cyclo-ligase